MQSPIHVSNRTLTPHECYDSCMHTVASRELRNQTRALLNRVEAGEEIAITVDGRPVAVLSPLERRRRRMSRDEFMDSILRHQADPGLPNALDGLAPDTTDDIQL